MLSHDEVLEEVKRALGGESLLVVAKSVADDGYLTVTVTNGESSRAENVNRNRATIGTFGVEAFFLDLDGKYDYQDFDWDPTGQREILVSMSRLAAAYLAGNGHERSRRESFRRLRTDFVLSLGDTEYVFSVRRA